MVGEFFPEMVGGICAPQDPNQAVISYSDYLMNAKMQVAAAKKLQELITHHSESMAHIFSNWKSSLSK